MANIMGNQNAGFSPLPDLRDEFHYFPHLFYRQGSGGFIQDKDIGFKIESTANGNSLFFTPGKIFYHGIFIHSSPGKAKIVFQYPSFLRRKKQFYLPRLLKIL